MCRTVQGTSTPRQSPWNKKSPTESPSDLIWLLRHLRRLHFRWTHLTLSALWKCHAVSRLCTFCFLFLECLSSAQLPLLTHLWHSYRDPWRSNSRVCVCVWILYLHLGPSLVITFISIIGLDNFYNRLCLQWIIYDMNSFAQTSIPPYGGQNLLVFTSYPEGRVSILSTADI